MRKTHGFAREMLLTRIGLLSESALVAEALMSKFAECRDFELVQTDAEVRHPVDLVAESALDVVVLESTHDIEEKLEIVKSLSSRFPGTKVLVLSAESTSWHVAFRLVRAGARGFLPASVGSDEVVDAIRKLVRDELYLPPALQRKFAERHALGYDKLPEELLTDREFQVMRKLARGRTTREIAAELCISSKTVDTHRASVLRKLGLRNNSEITRFAIQIGEA